MLATECRARRTGGEGKSRHAAKKNKRQRTERDIVVALYGHVLRPLDVVDALQDGQAVADAGDAHLLQVVVQQSDQGLADDLIV